METILKLKNWQVFPILFLGYLLTVISIEDYPGVSITFKALGFTIIFGWILVLGKAISKISKGDDSLFTINAVIVISFFILFSVIAQGKEFNVEGILAIPLMYLLFAIAHIFVYPVKELKSIELNRDAKFKDYWRLFLLMIFWIIGIWFIQPRLNKVIKNKAIS